MGSSTAENKKKAIITYKKCGLCWACCLFIVAMNFDQLAGASICIIMTFFHSRITPRMWVKDVMYALSSPKSAFEELLFTGQPGDSHESRVCRTSMYTKFAEEMHSGTIMSPMSDSRVTLPPAERAEAYHDACLESFKNLPDEVKQILMAIDPVPPPSQFHGNLTHPWLTASFTKSMFMSPFHEQFGVVQPDVAYQSWVDERMRVLSALPELERKTEKDLANVPERYLEGFRQLDLWPVKDTWIRAHEIPAAMQQGLTAVFDATELCGKEAFNLSIPDIAELHGQSAHEIPAFKSTSSGLGDNTYDTLAELAMRFKNWDAMGWQDYPAYGPFPDSRRIKEHGDKTMPSSWVIDTLIKLLAWNKEESALRTFFQEFLGNFRQMNSQTTVNLRRLPKLPVQDMHKNMGSPDWIRRTWSLLWIGPVGDFWHFDEADNLLISLSGTLYVAVMEQNYTDIISGSRNIGLGWNDLEPFYRYRQPGELHYVDRHPWIRKVPIHFLKLEPGMGITVPSKTYHNVMALDGNRVLLNCFMLPKWRQHHRGWFEPGHQSDTFMAMWYLKSVALARLWDTKRVGGYFSGYKLEHI